MLRLFSSWRCHWVHVQSCHELASGFIIQEALALLDLVLLVKWMQWMRVLLITLNYEEFAICPLEQLLDVDFHFFALLLV